MGKALFEEIARIRATVPPEEWPGCPRHRAEGVDCTPDDIWRALLADCVRREREACMRIAYEEARWWKKNSVLFDGNIAARAVARAIRARGRKGRSK